MYHQRGRGRGQRGHGRNYGDRRNDGWKERHAYEQGGLFISKYIYIQYLIFLIKIATSGIARS